MSIEIQDSGVTIRLDTLGPSVRTALTELTTQAVNNLAKDALASFKSKVPVFSKQLRNEHIQVDFAKKTQQLASARVYVVDQSHTATRYGDIQLSSELASILNIGIGYRGRRMKRRMNSIPAQGYISSYSGIGAGSPTSGWIDDAQLSFFAKTNLILGG